ncbi:MAG TPA: phosphoglucosamine mutase, partial [Bacteroidetes bacterium]|nr:phosphoglucosamine mutase [Bacteroidota bacterium]
MSRLMVSVSGIRGVVGENFYPDTIMRFVAAYGSRLGGGTVIVGRDSRTTGEMVENIVVGTLQAVGCDVVKIGIVPTPTVQMTIEKLNARGGIAITASHNPIQWNALKLMNHQGMFLDAEEGEEVLGRSGEGRF